MLGGTLVLALHEWLSRLYALSPRILLFIGFVNCLYACYSFFLASRKNRSKKLISFLVFANLTWSVVCLALLSLFMRSVSVFGASHLAGEAIFVGGLAILEWKYREQLAAREMVDRG